LAENIKKCSACGYAARYLYTAKFRIGGTSGGWKLLFGEWAELGEEMVPLNVYVCSNCGKVELYADEELRRQVREAESRR
jgi:predicted RNA-binding Zn-ribbon protein involved in translation (DUF1610 family)